MFISWHLHWEQFLLEGQFNCADISWVVRKLCYAKILLFTCNNNNKKTIKKNLKKNEKTMYFCNHKVHCCHLGVRINITFATLHPNWQRHHCSRVNADGARRKGPIASSFLNSQPRLPCNGDECAFWLQQSTEQRLDSSRAKGGAADVKHGF